MQPLFEISIPPCVLSVEEIWPDGDAPENPTAQDVVDRMKGGSIKVLRDWNLVASIEVNEINVGLSGKRTNARYR